MRIGLENAGWRIAFANDIDEDKWQLAKSQTGRAMLGAAQHRQAGADMTMREP